MPFVLPERLIPATGQVLRTDHSLEVALPTGETATLGLSLHRPDDRRRKPAVIIVPGGGNLSRDGRQPGDGVRAYARPVEVATRWAEALAAQGFLALSYDKRSCGRQHDAKCRDNPTSDLDQKGPVALATDLDAVCRWLQPLPEFNGRLVLFAHGQAAGVALETSCSREAAAVVLLGPIPRRVDLVMTEALHHRSRELRRAAAQETVPANREALETEALALKNLAASRQATFDSMQRGRFAAGSRVQGATVDYWRGWLALTDRAAASVRGFEGPLLVVLGDADLQYAPGDRQRILAWGKGARRGLVVVAEGDHHLLVDGELKVATVEEVLTALRRVLEEASAPALW